MNFNCARSNTRSLTVSPSTGTSWRSSSGAVAVSRLPVNLTVMAPASGPLTLFWIWISSGISLRDFRCVEGSLSTNGFRARRLTETLGQAQDILAAFAGVANFVEVTAAQLQAPAARQVLVLRLRLACRSR